MRYKIIRQQVFYTHKTNMNSDSNVIYIFGKLSNKVEGARGEYYISISLFD